MEPIRPAAIYSISPWRTFEHAGVSKNGKRLLWAGGLSLRERLGQRDAGALRRFVNIHHATPNAGLKTMVKFASDYGPLGLCRDHHLPIRHLSSHALGEIQRLLDQQARELLLSPEAGDSEGDQQSEEPEDGLWWSLRPCDGPLRGRSRLPKLRTPAGEVEAAHAEEIADWLRYADLLGGIVAVSWQLQTDRVADYRDFKRLQPLLDQRVASLPWKPRWDVDRELPEDIKDSPPPSDVPPLDLTFDADPTTVKIPDPEDPENLISVPLQFGGKGSVITKERERAAAEMKALQQRLLELALDRLIEQVDLRVRVRWTGRGARLTYGGGTFLGVLVAQLALTLGGHDALAVCDLCRTTWDPRSASWPRSGEGQGTYCPCHANPTDRNRHRRRVGLRAAN
jgi:hypothetical protein